MKRCIHLTLIALLVALLAGCSNLYATLSGDQLPDNVALLAAATSVKSQTLRVPVTTANGKKISVAVHVYGTGLSDHCLVLLHGMASDGDAWRFVRGALTDYDVITVDLPGCGASDAPDVSQLGEEGYSPTALARCVLQAVRVPLASRHGGKITLGGHSLGGAVVLRMYGDQDLRTNYQDVLRQVDSVVLLAPADMVITVIPPSIQTLRDLSPELVDFAKLGGLVHEVAAKAQVESMVYSECALRSEADRLAAVLCDRKRLSALQAMIKSIVPAQGNIFDHEQANRWTAEYRQVNVPCLLIWGFCDPVLPVSMGYKLRQELPNAQLRILFPVKHSANLEQPRACATLIRNFLTHKLGPELTAQIPVSPPARFPPAPPAPPTPRQTALAPAP